MSELVDLAFTLGFWAALLKMGMEWPWTPTYRILPDFIPKNSRRELPGQSLSTPTAFELTCKRQNGKEVCI
jgi:hypothetical protein